MIRKYFEKLNQCYSLTRIVIIALLFTVVLYYLDIYDIISRIRLDLIIVIGGAIMLLFLFYIIKSKAYSLLKIMVCNAADVAIVTIVLFSFLIGTVWGVVNGFCNYKTIVAMTILLVTFVLMILRIIRIQKHDKVDDNNIGTLYDLKDILNNQFELLPETPLLLAEKDVDYDLLERDHIIDQLYRTIINSKADHSFVIGLEGSWGSGKTTIINIVKKQLATRDDLIIIDDFDPWLFGDQHSLLIGMYDTILKKSNMPYGIIESRRVIDSVQNIVAGFSSAGGALGKALVPESSHYEDTIRLKNKMTSYLQLSQNTIVFIIDNIDRIDADNIIFLFKMIGTIFNLPHVIYVLSYDRERIEKIIFNTDKIDPNYLKKIIQVIISVPAISSSIMEDLTSSIFSNIIDKYDPKMDFFDEFKPVIDLLKKELPDLRELKRLLNSLNIAFAYPGELNKRDLLAIEIIHFLAPQLYKLIDTHYEFFVSYGERYDDMLLRRRFRKKEFNEEGKKFFEQLFQTYPSYLQLLACMFPNVKKYAAGSDLIQVYENTEADNQYLKKASICDFRYFDLYYSLGKNDFLSIREQVLDFIDYNNSNDEKSTCNKLREIMNGLPRYAHREWMEHLMLCIDRINKTVLLQMANVLLIENYTINDSIEFVALSGRARAVYIISLLLIEMTIDEVHLFVNSVKDDYQYLSILCQIVTDIKHLKPSNDEHKQKVYTIIEHAYRDQCHRIITNTIDLYNDAYYHQYNIRGLIVYDKDSSVFGDYIRRIFNDRYIYRILGDVIGRSVGSHGYSYQINSSLKDVFNVTNQQIKKAIEKYPPKSESEEFVLKLYEKSEDDKEKQLDEFESGIILKKDIEMFL